MAYGGPLISDVNRSLESQELVHRRREVNRPGFSEGVKSHAGPIMLRPLEREMDSTLSPTGGVISCSESYVNHGA